MQTKGMQYVQKAYKDANVQCNIDSSSSKDASIMEETLDDSVMSENDFDSSYRISDNSEGDENHEPKTTTIKSHYTGYVVYWSCISILFKYCLSCGFLANIKIEMLITDRHSQIRKHVQEEGKNIDHQFDVWHFCKNVKQKLNSF